MNGLNKFVRDWTEKSRVLGQEENDSARTGQPSSQELRKGKIEADFKFSSAAFFGTNYDS